MIVAPDLATIILFTYMNNIYFFESHSSGSLMFELLSITSVLLVRLTYTALNSMQ